jgi:hypothetical protein
LRTSSSSPTPSRHSSRASTPIQSSDSDIETQMVSILNYDLLHAMCIKLFYHDTITCKFG